MVDLTIEGVEPIRSAAPLTINGRMVPNIQPDRVVLVWNGDHLDLPQVWGRVVKQDGSPGLTRKGRRFSRSDKDFPDWLHKLAAKYAPAKARY